MFNRLPIIKPIHKSRTTKNIVTQSLGIYKNRYVMYILINSELEMDTTESINFCCRAMCKIIINNERSIPKSEAYNEWVNNCEPIIILKALESDLIYCINKFSDTANDIWCHNIIDSGKSNANPFSLIVVAFTPIMESQVPDFIKNMEEL